MENVRAVNWIQFYNFDGFMILSVLFHVAVSLDFVGWSFSKQRFNILKQITMSKLMMTFICAQVH